MSDTLLGESAAAGEQQQQSVAGEQQPQQQSQQTATGYVDEGGNFREGWLDRLPPEFQESKQMLGRFRTLPDALKSLVESQRLVGKKTEGMVRLPGALKEGASEAEKRAHEQALNDYRKALGIPESPDKYNLKPEQLPDGMTWDDHLGGTFSQLAHKHNIPPAAMQELVGAYVQMEQSRAEAQAQLFSQELEKGKAALQEQWKGNFDANIKTASRMAKTLGLDPESPGLRDPAVVLALHRAASFVSEDRLVSGEFNASSTPGKDRGLAIINGNSSDPELIRLHKAYMSGDRDVSRLVDDLLKNG